jgi:hypothetical protein
MNKQQFNALSEKDKSLASEAYLDGFEAAIQTVASFIWVVGDALLDETSAQTREAIVDILRHNHNTLKKSLTVS